MTNPAVERLMVEAIAEARKPALDLKFEDEGRTLVFTVYNDGKLQTEATLTKRQAQHFVAVLAALVPRMRE